MWSVRRPGVAGVTFVSSNHRPASWPHGGSILPFTQGMKNPRHAKPEGSSTWSRFETTNALLGELDVPYRLCRRCTVGDVRFGSMGQAPSTGEGTSTTVQPAAQHDKERESTKDVPAQPSPGSGRVRWS